MASKAGKKSAKSLAGSPAGHKDELKRAEAELKASKEIYHTIVDSIEDGYYEVDLSGNFTFFNDAMIRITGHDRKELLGMNNRQIMDDYNARLVYQVFNKVYLTGLATKAFDWELIRKDGESCVVEVSVSLKRSRDGRPVGFIGIARDITSRRLMEKALQESEEKYRTIIENIEDGYYEVDLAGNFTFFNDAMSRMTGYSRQELMGMNNRQIMDDYNTKRVFQVFNTVFLTKMATKAFDWELICKDGSKRFIEVSVSLKKDLNGQPIGFMGIARDVTRRIEYEDTLRAREKELEIKSKNLEELNTALKVLLERREEDKSALEETVMTNINDMVMPCIEKIRGKANNKRVLEQIGILEENLSTITSTFSFRLSSRFLHLTSAEIEIANLVKQGRSTKEIADILNVARKTVEVHRLNIRKKLGITNRRASLRTHLLSIR